MGLGGVSERSHGAGSSRSSSAGIPSLRLTFVSLFHIPANSLLIGLPRGTFPLVQGQGDLAGPREETGEAGRRGSDGPFSQHPPHPRQGRAPSPDCRLAWRLPQEVIYGVRAQAQVSLGSGDNIWLLGGLGQ